MKRWVVSASVQIICITFAFSAAGGQFMDEVRKVINTHQALLDKASGLANSGHALEANKLLLSIAEPKGTPAARFYVGNLLYRSDTNASYRLHQQAFNAFPKEANTALEWAMERHRRGEFKEAIPLYRQALDSVKDGRFYALLADCLVRENQLPEAVAAWSSAKHGQMHTAIDFAIHDIYGKTTPVQRRSELRAKVTDEEAHAWEDLILLDAHFDTDWWNAEVNEKAMAADLKLAESRLGATSDRFRAMQLFAKLKREESGTAASVTKLFNESGFVLRQPSKLPDNSRLARALVELAVESKAESALNLMARYEPLLMERVKTTGDRDALHLLCWLCNSAENGRVGELARYGWEQWKDPSFGASYLAALFAQGKLALDDNDLQAALALVPEDNILNMIRLKAAGAAKVEPSKEMIVAAIKAEYRHLSMGLLIPDSYTLKGLFLALDTKLKQPAK